ncbi:MAG TPA: LptA/OstA family protein [Alphaproteobacteria bacterium]|nr:LptA/OstA family protein [Alphaproteobacteria bacterium]
MIELKRARGILLGAAALMVAAAPAIGQGLPVPGKRGEPVHIEAEKGIEWRQKKKVYVARGNATVKRGDITVRAETLTAHYRTKTDQTKPGATANGKAKPEAKPKAKPKAKPIGFAGALGGGGADVYKVTAAGNVRITQADKTIVGDFGVYDLDSGIFRLTGKHVSMATAKETITANQKIEYRTKQKIAIVVGNAIALKDGKKVRADRFTAFFANGKDGKLEIQRVIAEGNVVITTPTEVATADRGIYNHRSGIAQLVGSVKLTRGDNQLNGDRAEVNLKTGVSRLLAARGRDGRVRVLVVPGGDVGGGLSKGVLPGVGGKAPNKNKTKKARGGK